MTRGSASWTLDVRSDVVRSAVWVEEYHSCEPLPSTVNRRQFLQRLGVAVGAGLAASGRHAAGRGEESPSFAEALKEMHTVQYAAQIEKAIQAGQRPGHQPWGLGLLLRGDGPVAAAHDWFGIGQVQAPRLFDHAGISTILGVADPDRDAALVFLTTDAPKPDAKVGPLRSGVVAKVLAKLA
jgi:hypothetical protein